MSVKKDGILEANFMKKHKNCQSCGMPFSKDENGGGTEKNGEKSTTYCSHCYENEKFALPHITVGEMKQLIENKLERWTISLLITVFIFIFAFFILLFKIPD